MSHRKFSAPRHGSLAFLPRKRCRYNHGRIKAFPADDGQGEPHLTAFMGYKAGMTHVVRLVDKKGAKIHKKEVVEAVTILDVPPMWVAGVVGYVQTPRGLRALTTVWAQHLDQQFIRRMYKNFSKSKKRAFTKYANLYNSKEKTIDVDYARIAKHCQVVRLVCHTDIAKCHIGRRKAHVCEIQINGGSIEDKVKFAKDAVETQIPFSAVFQPNEMVDTIAITKGHGTTGVTTRWGTSRLPRKTHRGLRKVACIGAWHPARVQFQVARAGQYGYHHRTETNKKIYMIGKGDDPKSATTEFDITDKQITPLGGFVKYGLVMNDWVMIKGSVQGPRRRAITIRKSLIECTFRDALEEVQIKWINTASGQGTGRFQTQQEKVDFMGPTKRNKKAQLPRDHPSRRVKKAATEEKAEE